ncbi:efflux RND transporter periplasmic adaptor subunit [Pseudomonas sp. CCC3.1]|uniref:efflux RND transporter periplasmic adaptor subunit n=1 Tax=Pseudomonas sp. CCC3.1 TaxID=3048607 RepID=UPI002AC89782|nr:efflux RND transporter periplasmic adaptor subunit [Pseudomonas sp. CCC3.1]MEB0207450.1 efflux RND transporter periplasmic adaptor subunit [Pseudomonas sp. CCC3.1]WPX36151.1 efflux RND transporter periplasmic adaptor subunit [Pseudomonas sp. CCC3.1]
MAGQRVKCVWGLSLLALLTACGKEGPKEPLSPRVYVQQVSTREFAPPIQLSGDIQARVETQLSFRVGGKIIERQVDVGDHIQANQVLARLDPKDLKIQVQTAQASVYAQQAQVVQTRAAFIRQQKLLPKGYTSQSEYDAANAAQLSAQSALTAAQAQLANAREQLSYSNLVAEAPGIITARQAEVGQVVQATMPIFTLARDGARDAVFNVYESLFIEPPKDPTVQVTLLSDPTIKVNGQIREITPTVAAQSGTLQIKVQLDTLPKGMELGSIVSVNLTPAPRPSVELPWSALTKDVSEPAVWVVDGQNNVRIQRVTVGRYLTGSVIINDGLKDGENVVVAGGQLLHPGMQVEITPVPAGGMAL